MYYAFLRAKMALNLSSDPDLPNSIDSGCLNELSPTESAEPRKRPQRESTQQFLQKEMYGMIEPSVIVQDSIKPTEKYDGRDCFEENEKLHNDMMHRSRSQILKEIKNGKAGKLFNELRASGLSPLESFKGAFLGRSPSSA